ncbi:AAA family ATPase [Candidatus Woesearchaeota archaeon]|nr:AAA family ATPase [Candidatus Woesearchaeota archaeon]
MGNKKPRLYFGGEGLLKKVNKAKISQQKPKELEPKEEEPAPDFKEMKEAAEQEVKKEKYKEDFKEIHEHKPLGHIEPHIKGNIKIKHKPSKLKIEREATGIPGLDEVIEGGLKRNSVTLVGGCAGSGKSILAMQFIVNGILKYNEPGVYVTFEEDKEEVYEDMLRLGWDLAELEKQGKFAFLRYTPEQVGKVLKTGGGIIRDIIDKIKAKRIVVDSISAFTLLHRNELEKREACLDLFHILRKWACTTLVIGQYYAAEERHESTAVEFEVDGIIWLYNIKKEDIRVRAIEVFKMRGTKHAAKIFPFEITNEGIAIYPEQSVF